MSFSPPAPVWVSGDDKMSGGQDFMGLRNPGNRIGYVAMNGLTSVTPRVRYLALREWMLATWWRARGEDARGAFTAFAQGVEAAIVMANLRAGVTEGGLIGSTKGRARLLDPGPWTLESLVEIPGATIYAGATEQLGLDTTQFEQGGTLVVRKVAGPTVERGQGLARIVEEALRETRLGRKLCEGRLPKTVDAADLDELAPHVRLDRIPEAEREAVIDVLVPLQAHPDASADRRAEELRRIATYALVLELAARKGGLPVETDVFRAAAQGGRDLPECLRPVLDVWALFGVRDLLAACHEASMRGLTEALQTVAVEGEATAQQVLDELLSQGDALSRALRDLGLLGDSESWDQLRFRALHERVQDACSSGLWTRRGLARWEGGLSELDLAAAALGSAAGPAPLLLVPVAWSLSTLRLAPALAGDSAPFFDLLNAEPYPLRPQVEDEVKGWLDADLSLPELVAQRARGSVETHLVIAWTRMQRNVHSDTAHLHVEGEQWRPRQTWREGRSTSRLDNAIGWLKQLGLINEDGLSDRGRGLRDAALETLAREQAP